MKLLIVTQKVDKNDPILGFFHGWIARFAQRFEKVNVICLEKGSYDLPSNVAVHSLGKEERQSPSRLVYASRFYSLIGKLSSEYDAVFVHMNPIYLVLGGVFWKMLGKKTALWYVHRQIDLKLRIGALFSNVIFTASKESFRLKSKKVIVTGHGIDTELFAPDGHALGKVTKVISVSRLSEVKRVDALIEAVAAMPQDVRGAMSLDIVGGPVTHADRAYEHYLKDTVSRLGLSGVVRFAGAVQSADAARMLAASDVSVNMSATGGLDKAVLESMACGNVALSQNPALKSVLEPFGLFIEASDVQAVAGELAAAIRKASDQELKKRLRQYVVENHSLDSLIPRISERIASL